MVNVADYGAVGDGSTDDTEAIRAAANDAGQGGEVFFPSGTYLLGEGGVNRFPFRFPTDGSWNGQTWRGEDHATTKFRMSDGMDGFFAIFYSDDPDPPVGNFTIKQLELDLNKEGNTTEAGGSHAIQIDSGDGLLTMRDCIIRGAKNSTINIRDAMDQDIQYCEFYDNGDTDTAGHDINPLNSTPSTCTVKHCYFDGTAGGTWNIGHETDNDYITALFEDCYVVNAPRLIKVDPENDKTTIRNTYFRPADQPAFPENDGIMTNYSSPTTGNCGDIVLDNVHLDGPSYGVAIDIASGGEGGFASIDSLVMNDVRINDYENGPRKTFGDRNGVAFEVLNNGHVEADRVSIYGVGPNNDGDAIFMDDDVSGYINDLRWGDARRLGTTGGVSVDATEGGSQINPDVPSADEVGARSPSADTNQTLELSSDTYGAVHFRVKDSSYLVNVDGLDQLDHAGLDTHGGGFYAAFPMDSDVKVTAEIKQDGLHVDKFRGDSINAVLDGDQYTFSQDMATPYWPPDSWFTEQSEILSGGSTGPPTASNADYVASSESELQTTLSNAASGETVFVDSSFEVTSTITVPSGVRLASDRGQNSDGARLWTDDTSIEAVHVEADATVEGLRIEGPMDQWEEQESPTQEGVKVMGSGVEIYNCEIYGWEYAGVNDNDNSAHIHDCHIHTCAEIGYGYGVVVQSGNGHPVIEDCYFNYTRHGVAAAEGDGGYTVRNCRFGVDTMDHFVDHHGPTSNVDITVDNCTFEATEHTDRDNYKYGPAQFDNAETEAIRIRAHGDTGDSEANSITITNNWFYHGSEPSATGGDGQAIWVDDSASTWDGANVSLSGNSYGTAEPDSSIGTDPRGLAGYVDYTSDSGGDGSTGGNNYLGDVPSNPLANNTYDNVLHAVDDLDMDRSGETEIDDALEGLDDNTKVIFPDGEYLFREVFIQASNIQLTNETGAEPTFIHEDTSSEYGLLLKDASDYWIEGITIDTRASNRGNLLVIPDSGDFFIKDVTLLGVMKHSKEGLSVSNRASDGLGIIRNFRAMDGSGYDSASHGIFVAADHAGEMWVADCKVGGWSDNGLYGSSCGYNTDYDADNPDYDDGEVNVRGGLYKNNNISNVRIGSTNSSVKGVNIEVRPNYSGDTYDSREYDVMPRSGSEPSPVVNSRGIWMKNREGMVVEGCDVDLEAGGGSGALVMGSDCPALTVKDTRLRCQTNEYVSIVTTNGPRSDLPSGALTFDNVSITGTANTTASYIEDRDGSSFVDSCINVSGIRGLSFNNSDSSVQNTSITADGENIRENNCTVTQTNVTSGESCPAPMANHVPVADAGPDQTATSGDGVALDGTGSSDIDGDTLSYSWVQTEGPTASLSSTDISKPSLTAPDVDVPTTLTYELTVSDGKLTDTDFVSIDVEPKVDDGTGDDGDSGGDGDGGSDGDDSDGDGSDGSDGGDSGPSSPIAGIGDDYGESGWNEGPYGGADEDLLPDVSREILWETTADWDTNQSSYGIHHQQPDNTDWAPSNVIEKGHVPQQYDASLYLPLDENSGGAAYDISGGENHAVINGATVDVTGSGNSTAFRFNGNEGSNLIVPDAEEVRAESDISMKIVADATQNMTPAESGSYIAGKARGTDVEYGFIWDDTNSRVKFRITDSEGNSDEVYTAQTWGPNDGPTTFSVAYDGEELTLYRDGVRDATALADTDIDNSGGQFFVGGNPNYANGGEGMFDGTVDEVLFWNTDSLNGTEMERLHETYGGDSVFFTSKEEATGVLPDLITDTSIPETGGIEITIYEDLGADNSGNLTDPLGNFYDNSYSTTLSGDAGETHTIDDELTGGTEVNQYWCRVRVANNGNPFNASPTINSIELQFLDPSEVSDARDLLDITDGRNIQTAEDEWESPITFRESSNMHTLIEGLLRSTDDFDDNIEEAYNAQHIDGAEDEDLDNLGDFVGVKRQTGEGDSKYRTRIKAEFRSSTIGTTTDQFIEFVLVVLDTDADNIDFQTTVSTNGPTVSIFAEPFVWESQELTAAETVELLNDAVPAGHGANVRERGTFVLKSDGDQNRQSFGLTADNTNIGGTLASDIVGRDGTVGGGTVKSPTLAAATNTTTVVKGEEGPYRGITVEEGGALQFREGASITVEET